MIFDALLEPLLTASLSEGLDSTLNADVANVLCYGERKSGKTYTMLAVAQLVALTVFAAVEASCERKFLVRLSGFQVAGDCVYDLCAGDKSRLELIETANGDVRVKDLAEVVCTDFSSVNNILNKITEVKSPSELVCTFIVESRGTSGPVKISAINLIRLSDSSGKVTKSLNALNLVIQRLASNKKLPSPYERSKLTKYLQKALSGNSKVAFICTMSPAFTSYEVSKNTLEFASNAKAILVNPKQTSTENLLDSFLLQYEEQYKSIRESMQDGYSSDAMLKELRAAILVPGQLEDNSVSAEHLREIKKRAKRIRETNLPYCGKERISETERAAISRVEGNYAENEKAADATEELKDLELKEVVTFSAKTLFDETLSEYSKQIAVVSYSYH